MADKTVYVDGTTSTGHYATLAAALTGEASANANLVNWPQAVRPLSWLVDHFALVPSWDAVQKAA